MHIQVTSKNVDVSPALRERAQDRIADAVQKYFPRSGDAYVSVGKDGPLFRVDVVLHLPTGATLQSHASAQDAYAAAEDAFTRLEKRLRRYKRRIQDRRARGENGADAEALQAAFTVLAPVDGPDVDDEDTDESAEPGAPVIVAESTADLPLMSVASAVWELDITNAPALVFRNESHGRLNVIFRRADGHIGWIDPNQPSPAS